MCGSFSPEAYCFHGAILALHDRFVTRQAHFVDELILVSEVLILHNSNLFALVRIICILNRDSTSVYDFEVKKK